MTSGDELGKLTKACTGSWAAERCTYYYMFNANGEMTEQLKVQT